MSVLISNVGMERYDERNIPEVIKITFTNGDTVGYTRIGQELSRGNLLSKFKLPKYEFEDKIDAVTLDALEAKLSANLLALEDKYKSAVEHAKMLFLQENAHISSISERRLIANEQLHANISREMLNGYRVVKRNMGTKLEALKDPSRRMRMIIKWLRETKVTELVKSAELLEHESDYILQRMKSAVRRYDSFLSHVQKQSSDLCRNIRENCMKRGLSMWYDKTADRLDARGMADSILESSVFILVLTKEYFKRPFCVYEHCIAIVAGKPVITIFESDERYGGGPLGSFGLNEMFKHVLRHEIIEIHRSYWESFIVKLHDRIEKTLKSGEEDVMAVKKTGASAEGDLDSLLDSLESEAALQDGNSNIWIEAGGPEMKDESTSSTTLIKRDPKHIFSVVFQTKPLGLILTPCKTCSSAYVTGVDGKMNTAVKGNKLPLYSKLLTVRGTDVELLEFKDILDLLQDNLRSMPLELTFCHPDGLDECEIPAPSE